ncbi:hypothetical protein ACEQ6A_33050, partial [Rhizobium brockwellii]|uniref:hypothetical protein n=1 Tax=Rhizobium brockwellii TaxID=3019932 RepID=UPI003F9A9944
GWSSPVARQAHNLKAAGSNPAPATKPSSLKIKVLLVEQPARRAIDSLDRLLIRLASSGGRKKA